MRLVRLADRDPEPPQVFQHRRFGGKSLGRDLSRRMPFYDVFLVEENPVPVARRGVKANDVADLFVWRKKYEIFTDAPPLEKKCS